MSNDKHKPRQRPDSLRLELLTIPEDSVTSNVTPRTTGLLPERINLEFRNICYSPKCSFFSKEHVNILQGLSGEFYSGELAAIMGPSGAGKSTLLNILTGYTSIGVHGTLSENGMTRDPAEFKRRSCYIMQDDQLQPLLTVQEAMFVAANLMLPSKMSPADKGARVKEILKSIGLYECRKTKTGSLSGGQRKRLAIALELTRNPPVMFFDEPTSGLDSSTSKQLVSLLKQLAQDGRTIVCTIHQPSATLFEMFDHLYAIAEGKCLYQGSVKGVVPYLEGIDPHLKCPPYHNPADYLLEVSRGEYGDVVDDLVRHSENGANNDWRKRQIDFCSSDTMTRVEIMMGSGLVTPVKAPKILLDKCPSPPPTPTISPWCKKDDSYTSSFATQIFVLLKRNYLVISRDRQLTYTRIGMHLLIAMCIGILYFGIGTEATFMLDNFNYLFFTIMFNMFTAFSSMIVAFANEMPILTREHFNRWYSVKSYFLAMTLADLPIQLFSTFLYVGITYYMTEQPMEAFRFGLFLAMCYLVSLVAQSFGMLVSAALKLQNAFIFGPMAIMPFLVFSGFFVHMNDAPTYMKWLFHASFLRYALEGVSQAIFGYDRAKMTCSADYCHFVYPDKFLDQVGMDEARYSFDVLVLIIMYFGVRLTTYATLLIRVGGKR